MVTRFVQIFLIVAANMITNIYAFGAEPSLDHASCFEITIKNWRLNPVVRTDKPSEVWYFDQLNSGLYHTTELVRSKFPKNSDSMFILFKSNGEAYTLPKTNSEFVFDRPIEGMNLPAHRNSEVLATFQFSTTSEPYVVVKLIGGQNDGGVFMLNMNGLEQNDFTDLTMKLLIHRVPTSAEITGMAPVAFRMDGYLQAAFKKDVVTSYRGRLQRAYKTLTDQLPTGILGPARLEYRHVLPKSEVLNRLEMIAQQQERILEQNENLSREQPVNRGYNAPSASDAKNALATVLDDIKLVQSLRYWPTFILVDRKSNTPLNPSEKIADSIRHKFSAMVDTCRSEYDSSSPIMNSETDELALRDHLDQKFFDTASPEIRRVIERYSSIYIRPF